MRRLILKMQISVDGFVGGPNGESSWILKSLDDGAAAWMLDTLWHAGVHIMGGRTFQDMAAYWPSSPEPFAAPMNEIPKVAFSSRGIAELLNPQAPTSRNLIDAWDAMAEKGLKPASTLSPGAASWGDTTVASGDLASEIVRLKEQSGKDILAHGGSKFAQSLVKLGLIDEYRLMVHPAALGRGLPLFSALSGPMDLKLISSTPFSAGVMANVYRPA
jgi:dihydrofolate reductase